MSDLAPIETLRAAAALMRKRAAAATPGASLDRYAHGGGRMLMFESDDLLIAVPDFFDEGNREHYAAWHPVVALAVADWLDRTADDLRPGEVEGLAVARAYLGAPEVDRG